jgi:hypothetical protein
MGFVIISEVKILDFFDIMYIILLKILSPHYEIRLPAPKKK